LRRVTLLCCHFARNLAYYRSGFIGARLVRDTEFWRTVSGNFIDLCVLEWCKLFGDRNEEHYWRRIVSNPATFEAGLLNHIRITASEFEQEIQGMRRYRDKFVAHLDSDKVMHIPNLDVAKNSAWFYHAHVVCEEAEPDDLVRLPKDIEAYHRVCVDEANQEYGGGTR
jgi:hypothetical protein